MRANAFGPRMRLRVALFLGIGLGVASLMLVAYALGLLRTTELSTVDARFTIRGEQAAPPRVVVVDIGDPDISSLGRFPFPRALHARAIDRLRQAGARVIAYDIQFSERSETFEEDEPLLEAARRAGNVVFGTTPYENGQPAFLEDDMGRLLRYARARAGSVVFPEGSVIRRLPYQVGGLKSFAIVAAEAALGRPIERDELGGDRAWIDYYGPPGTVETVPFARLLGGGTHPHVFRGRIVVVGVSASTEQDLHETSVSRADLMAGDEIQANAIATALAGFPLTSPPRGFDVALIVLFALLAPAASLRLSLGWTLALALATAGAFVIVTQVAFERGWVLPFVYPFGSLVLSSIGALGAHYLSAGFERERLRDAFSRFVPEQVVDQVLARADGVRLGGIAFDGTIVFTDLRGFTTFSESLPPGEVIETTNHYLQEMSDAVLEHGGTLIGYEGDGLLAVFGAPIELDDHADRAVEAAREIVAERLPRLNEWMRASGLGEGFRIGIGVNSGTFVAGNVGSERRLEYTVMGDVVNAASRIQEVTKGTRHMLLMADTTCERMRRNRDDVVYVGEFELRGRQMPSQLWSLESISDSPVRV